MNKSCRHHLTACDLCESEQREENLEAERDLLKSQVERLTEQLEAAVEALRGIRMGQPNCGPAVKEALKRIETLAAGRKA
jgi:hypothetical protein